MSKIECSTFISVRNITGASAVVLPSRLLYFGATEQHKTHKLVVKRYREIWQRDVLSDSHDDVIKWKHFPRYWPFVRGIHRFPVNSPHKGQCRGALMFSLICVWINGWSKQSWGWWFETLSRSLWRHSNDFSWSAMSWVWCSVRPRRSNYLISDNPVCWLAALAIK